MIVRNYGLLDTVSKEVVRTFTSNNDESAQRTVEIMLRDPKTDRTAAKDFVLKYLFSFDSADGSIKDIQQKEIIALAAIMPENIDFDKASADEIRQVVDGLVAQVKELKAETTKLNQALQALAIPIKALDPAFGQVRPFIDQKKGKVIWLPKK